MKVLILGVDGMIGHKIAQSLISDFHVVGSTRKNVSANQLFLQGLEIFHKDFLRDDASVFFDKIQPDIIINCNGNAI